MREVRVAVVLGAVAIGAVACGEQQSESPARAVAPSLQAVAPPAGTPVCSFNTLTQLANSYFTVNDTAQLVRSLVRDMKSAGANTVTARSIGFDVMGHMAANIGLNPDFQTGSDLANGLLACMISDAAQLPAAFPEDFTIALNPNANGAFAVRGGANDPDGPVLARLNSFSGIAPSAGTWTAAISGVDPARVLFYGKPVSQSPQHYDWREVPRTTTFDPPLVVAVCVDPFSDDRLMLRKNDAEGIAYLPFVDAGFLVPGECGSTNVGLSGSWLNGSVAGRLLRFGSALLSPRPLQAERLFNPGGLGGATGGVRTEYGPDIVDTVTLTFLIQPHDARVCTAGPCAGDSTFSPVTILATRKGYPVGGVRIDVEGVNNNGTGADILGTHPLVSGEDGTVTFTDLGQVKPGGYTLLTQAELVVQRSTLIVIPHVTSEHFNIRP